MLNPLQGKRLDSREYSVGPEPPTPHNPSRLVRLFLLEQSMSTEANQAQTLKLVMMGALAEDGDLDAAKSVKAQIEQLVEAANAASDGVGDGALMLAYCDYIARSV
ncbi:hypothetical protein J2X18_002205 [Acidovorax delafieldii]|nr:hypothetical protein [Acidovorax delafieldii]